MSDIRPTHGVYNLLVAVSFSLARHSFNLNFTIAPPTDLWAGAHSGAKYVRIGEPVLYHMVPFLCGDMLRANKWVNVLDIFTTFDKSVPWMRGSIVCLLPQAVWVVIS